MGKKMTISLSEAPLCSWSQCYKTIVVIFHGKLPR
jgi:hypothetical protein